MRKHFSIRTRVLVVNWMVKDRMDKKTCEVCNNHFLPKEHRLGIVVGDHHFVCEPCTKKIEEDTLISHSIMTDVTKEMPIALWLINEENRDKHFMSVKK